jgi:hypothetical protein
MEYWPLLLGWPALLAAIALAGFGTFSRKPWKLYIASILILPLSLYLAGTPRLGFTALLPPAALLAAGIAIRYNKVNLAWSLLFPVIAFYSWLIFVIQQGGG